VLTAWCVLGNDRWQGEPGIAPLIEAATGHQLSPGVVHGELDAGQPRRLGNLEP
jgi:hypothetical protein